MESRMKAWINIVLFLCLPFGQSLAQSTLPLASEAAELCEAGQLNAAQTVVEKSMLDAKEKKSAYAWYVAGFVYKEIYKTSEQEIRNSSARDKAVNYLKTALQLDKSGEHTQNIKAALRFLSISYFNDALKRTKEINSASSNEPEEIYSNFRNTMRLVNIQTDFTEYDKQLFKALGQAHYKLWESDTKTQSFASRSAEYYQRVLMLDENDCEALFNLVILYYNQGVIKIRSLDISTDISEMIPIQESAIRQFNKAMPYAKKCFETCPAKVEYYKGLMFCHRALGNEEEFERLKKELEIKIQTGQLQQKK